jgi:long-subunit acyl-CoA synthetase (AMP-forming)
MTTGALLGPEKRGLIFVRSPTIMKGYITHTDPKVGEIA